MRLNWQHASSEYRLRKKLRETSTIKEKIRKVTKGEIEKSHDGTGGRLGTGSLGKHRNKDDDIEGKIIRRELKRCGLI